MKVLTTLQIIGRTVVLWIPTARAQKVVFYDNFESGTLDNWTATYGTPLTIDNGNADPLGGMYSAHATSQGDRMHHNLIADNGGVEVSGASWLTAFIYDSGQSSSRWHVQALGYSGTGVPNGGTTADGTLTQLLAIGKYATVTLPGEIWDGTKYQGRVAFGSSTGYFNLDAPGAPSRSPGWHKFTIQRLADETTINFYVDDMLGRTITGATAQGWDTITMGYGAGSFPDEVWYDGIRVIIPEPSVLALWLVGGWVLARSLMRRTGTRSRAVKPLEQDAFAQHYAKAALGSIVRSLASAIPTPCTRGARAEEPKRRPDLPGHWPHMNM